MSAGLGYPSSEGQGAREEGWSAWGAEAEEG